MKKTLLLALLALLPAWAFSCRCAYITEFCTIVTPQSDIATVRIIDTLMSPDPEYQYPVQWINVVVVETLQGAIEHDTMTILASRLTSCDPSPNSFGLGDLLIVHLRDAIDNGPTGHFTFSFENVCAQDFLRIDNGQIRNWRNGSSQEEAYDTFRANLGACARQLFNPVDQRTLESLLSVSPQPAKDEAWIELRRPLAVALQFELFSVSGQFLLEGSIPAEQARQRLDVSKLPAGAYLLRFQLGEVSVVRKLVVI